MPLAISDSKNQYEVNSETLYFSNDEITTSDLRLLLGRKILAFNTIDLRIALGGYGYYQDSKQFDYSLRQGFLAQTKINLWRNLLFLVYEYHEYSHRHDSSRKYENRFGLYGGYFQPINERTYLDIYAESFYIPEVSSSFLLSNGRASIYWNTKVLNSSAVDLLTEIYSKSAPQNWGGSRHELRLGVKYQPWDFISFRVFQSIVSSDSSVMSQWQAQINVYKVGDF